MIIAISAMTDAEMDTWIFATVLGLLVTGAIALLIVGLSRPSGLARSAAMVLLLALLLAASMTLSILLGGLLFIGLIAVWIHIVLVSRRVTAMTVFCTLGACTRQNLPLPTALEAEAMGRSDPGRRVLHQIANLLSQGMPLSEALARGYPKCPGFARAMVAAGERMNQLPAALEKVQAQMAAQSQQDRRIQPVHPLYPLVVLGFAVFLVTLLLVFVVPRLAMIYTTTSSQGSYSGGSPVIAGSGHHPEAGPLYDAPLPWATQLLIDIADVAGGPIVGTMLTVLLLALPCVLLTKFRPRNPQQPYLLSRLGDWLKWRLPILGWFERTLSTLQTVSMLRLALQSGSRMDVTLDSIAQLDTNTSYRRRLAKWRTRVVAGEDISAAARRSGVGDSVAWAFDQSVNAGNVPSVLEMLETFYRTRYSYRVNLMRYILWPLVTLLLALMIGFVVFALFAPLPAMNEAMMKAVLP